MKTTKEQIEKDLELRYPNVKIVYAPDKAIDEHGGMTFSYDDIEIVSNKDHKENTVYWNEKNQSNKIKYRDGVEAFIKNLNEASIKAFVFDEERKKEEVLADGFNRASNNGMILVIKSDTLPNNAFTDETNIKGKIIGASVIEDRKEDIESQLIDLYLFDKFDKSMSDTIVELAIDILSHHGDLEFE